jgi:peroxiredoxin Q/BCP
MAQRKSEEYPGFAESKVNKGKLKKGNKLPNFKVASTGDEPFSLSDYKDKNIVLFFYPKDSTPGCTNEGHDFTGLHKKFKKLDTEIFGISKDSLKSHFKFIEKQGYTFDLLSDEEKVICNFFEVIKEKKLYGRQYLGIERSTFFIEKGGRLVEEWRGVKVPGHADEVFEFVKSHAKSQ